MRKKEERKKHDKLAIATFGGTAYTDVTAWRDFLLTTDDEYRFTCAEDWLF